ncbi:MAG: hypothetical protein Fur006_40950 [Coleofasciculaceae cyanobacterium]
MSKIYLITGLIFLASGVIQILRTEYVASVVWVALGIGFLLNTEPLQLSDIRQGSLRGITAVIALIAAISFFGYQIFQDYRASHSSERGYHSENNDRGNS